MNKIKKLSLLITDWELSKKPFSTEIRENLVKDILRVDPAKWFHPKLPDGEVNLFCGEWHKDENDNAVFQGIDYDIYKYKHPNLAYAIDDYPLSTCKHGDFCNTTRKDREIIRSVFYGIKDKSSQKIFGEPNPKRFASLWYILYYKLKEYLFVLSLLPIIGLAFYCYPAITTFLAYVLILVVLFTPQNTKFKYL